MSRHARIALWALRLLLLGLSAYTAHSYFGQARLIAALVFGGAFLLTVMAPRWLMAAVEAAVQWAHERAWADVEGEYHAFAGEQVPITDDGRHVWMLASALKRLLARPEADDVLAARISGRWKHDDRGQLWLRVDGVVEHLSQFPGRMDPRVQKLRRWLERDVLFVADRRHARQDRQR